jgi:hypothetical protein
VKSSGEDGDGLPPAHARIASPYDIDTRWSVKRDTFWNGFKLHVTETCTDAPADERAHPNLITHVATTASTEADIAALPGIHARLDGRGLVPGEHYVDSGYASAESIAAAESDYGTTLITPVLLDNSVQARAGAGYAAADFTPDWKHQQVTCPQGQVSSSWSSTVQRGRPVTVVKFPTSVCGPCPVRAQCTTGTRGSRQLTLNPKTLTETLQTRRTEQTNPDWQARYALRAGVEGTIRQAVAVTASRRARYRGITKTRLEHTYSATALNLIRLDAWWNNKPLDRSRTSHLARLEHALAA